MRATTWAAVRGERPFHGEQAADGGDPRTRSAAINSQPRLAATALAAGCRAGRLTLTTTLWDGGNAHCRPDGHRFSLLKPSNRGAVPSGVRL